MRRLHQLWRSTLVHGLVLIIAIGCFSVSLGTLPALGQGAPAVAPLGLPEPATFPTVTLDEVAGLQRLGLKPDEAFIRTELFFGSQRAGQPDVSEAEFRTFLSDTVTPRFPDGLTLLIGDGQFRNARGEIIRERSFVLILLYPTADRRDKSGKIEEIRQRYKERFSQESVLRVDDLLPVRVSF